MADIPLDPLGPDRGEDDHNDDQHETSFGGDDWTRESERYKFPSSHHENQAYEPDEETTPLIGPVERLERDKEAGEAFFREKFVNPDFRNLVCGLDDNGRYWVKLVRASAKTHYVKAGLRSKSSGFFSQTLLIKYLSAVGNIHRSDQDEIWLPRSQDIDGSKVGIFTSAILDHVPVSLQY